MSETAADRLAWRIGDVEIVRVAEWMGAIPHGAILADLTPDIVDAERPWIDPFVADDGRMVLSVHTFVVRSRDTTIVVDTCVGGHGERPLPHDDAFPERLSSEIDGGLEAVDVVLCTHLHFDHVGWNTKRDPAGGLVPTFPNARYLVSQPELDTVADHDDHDVGPVSIDPLRDAGLLDAVATDHRITSEVRLLSTPGHTPGHVSVLIESAGETALITGDATHSPIQFRYPELSAERFDADTPTAIGTRRHLIERLVDTDTLVLGTHFPPPTAGHVVAPGGRATFRALDDGRDGRPDAD